ncbi:MAG TPA: DNA internalization-related competence protein ComEC/Rec2 [Gammaproteobacteria bacterium]|nr:DNA internalization-related competence protein ComEC/Rec2 [Gammaproteobacteria bacterium]
MKQGRNLAIYGIAAVAGSMSLLWLPALPSVLYLWLLVPLLVLAWRYRTLRIVLVFAVGFCWAWWHAQVRLDDQLPAPLAGDDIVVTGEIISIPERSGPAVRFLFAPEETVRLPDKIRLSWYYPEEQPQAGERWQLTVRLRQPRGFLNPGGFDYEAWLFREGIGATGYVRDKPPAKRLEKAGFSILTTRAAVVQRIETVLADSPFTGVVAGLAVGHAAGVPDSQWQTLRATGTIHLMAISGFHITMLAGLVYFLTLRLWHCSARLCARVPAPIAAALTGLLAATIYALLAGFSVPTQRTLIMLAVGFGALLLRRPMRISLVLGTAALAIIIVDPFAVLAPGFWLSFIAVAVILYAAWRYPRPSGVRAFLTAQWAVTIGLLPLLLVFFGQTPLAGPIANLLAIPLFSLFVAPLCVLGVVLPAPLDAWCFEFAAMLLEYFWPVLEWLGNALPPLRLPAPGVFVMLLSVLAIALLLAPRAVPGRWLGCLLLLPLLLVQPLSPVAGSLRLTVLDVGQGLAVVVRTAQHTLIYDTGPGFSSGNDIGEMVILPYLAAKNIDRPDKLIISHSDNDHAGGADSILDAWPKLDVLAGQPRNEWQACHTGQQWHWDGVDFRMLHPIKNPHFDADNAWSCVLKISTATGSVLLTGDIQQAVERDLVQGQLPQTLNSDILIVPHHGSASSSSAAFIKAVSPDYALVSAGYNNRWDFPRPVVVKRYHHAHAHLLETAKEGTLRFIIDAQGVRYLGSYRRENQRIWRAK